MKSLPALLFLASTALAIPPLDPVPDPADALMAITREADSVTIQFYSRTEKEEVTFTDVFWLEKLSAVLAFASYKPQEYCFCVSYPIIRLTRRSELLGSLSVHHGVKLRVRGQGVSGDYLVGEQTGKAIAALADEKRKADK